MSKPQIDGIDAPIPSDEKGSYTLFGEKDVEAKGDGAQAPIFEQSSSTSSVGTFIAMSCRAPECDSLTCLICPFSGQVQANTSYIQLSEKGENTLVQGVYMAVFAVLGAFLRIVIAQLFGQECANPGTVGWLAASSPLCVTADGSTEREGGIIFADLPSNILGSFLMGMMQTTGALGLPVSVPIAWLSFDSWFQGWDIIHLAIRTGFCGSLTTFSSWNSEMVIMIIGTGSSYTTQIFRALFGYIIGMEVSLGSYVMGRKVAEWLFRATNPSDWEEAEAIVERKEEGVYINRDLPEFERRFLPNLDMPSLGAGIEPEPLEFLEKWRTSTEEARRVGHRNLDTLKSIENAVLVNRQQVSHADEAFALDAGWDVESLLRWARGSTPPTEKIQPNNHFLFRPIVAVVVVVALYAVLITLLFNIETADAYSVTYRTMVYACMWAPPGALLRWHLSAWNGQLPGSWSWFPVGTWTANIFGCMVSITAIALEYVSPAKGFWKIGTLRSVKVGFSGALTTVSTFVSEVHVFSKLQHKSDRAYAYIMLSLVPSCLLSLMIFLAIGHDKGY
jgi:CrcB protein